MIHKCPVCRYQPIVVFKEEESYCPECGWNSENTRMELEQTI